MDVNTAPYISPSLADVNTTDSPQVAGHCRPGAWSFLNGAERFSCFLLGSWCEAPQWRKLKQTSQRPDDVTCELQPAQLWRVLCLRILSGGSSLVLLPGRVTHMAEKASDQIAMGSLLPFFFPSSSLSSCDGSVRGIF